MGGYISKLFYHDEHDKTLEYNSSSLILENRDTCTPQPQKKKSLIDPRSATSGITRTPIEVLSTPQKESKVISSVPKYLKRKPYLETNFDLTPQPRTLEKSLDPRSPSVDIPRTPITVESFPGDDTPKHSISNNCNKTNLFSEMHQKILGIDPRSPAVDFDRTPILKPKSLEIEKAFSQENLNINTHEIKMKPSRLSYCETTDSTNILEVNVLPDITDLNNSQKSVTEISCTSNSGNLSNNSVVTVLRNRNETSLDNSLESSSSDCPLEIETIEGKGENFEDKLIADSDKMIDNVLNMAMKGFENKISEAENKIKIWRDTMSPETEEDSEYDSESESEDHSENQSPKNELIIEYDDDVNVLGTIKKTEYNRKKITSVERKNFRKEIEIMKNVTPVKKQNNENKKSEMLKIRTPLRNRLNSNSQQQGTELKSPHLRRKVLLSSTKLQENTPPRTRKPGLKSKFNNTQWDGDSTFII